jgi:hypothetical protein
MKPRQNPHTAQRRWIMLVSGIAATIIMAGCTASQSHPSPSDATSTPHSTAHATAPAQITGATALPTNIPNTAALRSRVQITSCTKITGGWKAAGTASNPTKKNTYYTVTVFFLASTGTVLGSGQTRPHVPAGKTSNWSISDHFTAPTNTRCALRGVGQ